LLAHDREHDSPSISLLFRRPAAHGFVWRRIVVLLIHWRNFTIARRRYFRPGDNFNRGPNINERIRANPVRLIDENDEMIGVVETIEALRRAYDAGLDLVEVAADSSPPVCRILDFGKYKYELAKKEKATKAKSKTSELKEVRLGRSMKIDPHDIEIRLKQAKKFLLEGHKVQIVQNFRGREMIHRDRGTQRMNDIIEELSELGKVETPPRMAGRRMTMIMAPDKPKVEAYKRAKAKQKLADASDAEAAKDDAPAKKDASSKKSSNTSKPKTNDSSNEQVANQEVVESRND